MKLYIKFIIYFLILLMLVISSYVYIWKIKDENLESVNKIRIEEFKHVFSQIVELKTMKSKVYAYDYSYWDEMIDFLLSNDKEWASINLADTIKTFESDYVYIVNKNGEIIHKEFSNNSVGDISNLLDKKDFDITKPIFHNYFVKTSSAPVQIFVAPVQFSKDTKRETKPFGYMVVGKVWTKEFIDQLAIISRQNIQLTENISTKYDINYDLISSDGKKIYTVGLSMNRGQHEMMDGVFSSQLIFISAIGFVVLFLLLLFIYKYILNPLKTIAISMQEYNPKHLEKLKNEDNEFGQIANLINLFFIQKAKLQNINEELENKVKARTSELETINRTLDEKINIEVEARRKQDEILFRQTKMAAMGEMIGNIAHQWRQPLSVISTVASGLKLQIEYKQFNEKEAISDLENLNQSTQYLSQTIDDFRNFFKPEKEKTKFSLNTTLDKTLSLLKNKFNANFITLVFEKQENIYLDGFQNELTQSLINIVNNAADALEENKIQQKYIFIKYQMTQNNSVELTILDNAGGIPDSVLPKIFEPYFTTKHQSIGTGLGLYMTEEIIVKHFRGNIEVKNEEYEYQNTTYKGACFRITIPISAD